MNVKYLTCRNSDKTKIIPYKQVKTIPHDSPHFFEKSVTMTTLSPYAHCERTTDFALYC